MRILPGKEEYFIKAICVRIQKIQWQESFATMLVSQLPITEWYKAIDEATLADAIMDRITSNAHCIELKGESLRRKKSNTLQ